MLSNIEKTIRGAVCSRCKQDCLRRLEQMQRCDLVASYVRTHKNREFVSASVSAGIIDTHQIKRKGDHDVLILSHPNKDELKKILATICRRYHDKLIPCSGCPIDQALKDLNISMDTFEIFYAPYFPVNCKCHREE